MRRGAKIVTGGVLILLISLAGLGLGGWLIWLAIESSNRTLGELMCIGGTLMTMFSGAVMLLSVGVIRSGLTAAAVDVKLDVRPTTARLGEALDVRVAVTPQRPVLAGPAYVRLVKEECLSYWVRSLLSKTQRRKEEEAAETTVQEVTLLTPPAELPPEIPFRWSARLHIPPDEAASFQREEVSSLGKDVHCVNWKVTLDLALKGWPDAGESVELQVLPVSATPLPAEADAMIMHGSPTDPLNLALARTRVQAGDTLDGTVHWAGESASDVWVSLGYRVIAEARTWTTVVDQANFRLSAGAQAPFALDVPVQGPLSYQGQLFTIRWFLLAKAGNAQREVELQVTAREEVQTAGELQRAI
jgi:hypothetical protein